ncbi:MAG: BamA/TamA family outer membrane protein [Gemmatimonadota bacterium]
MRSAVMVGAAIALAGAAEEVWGQEDSVTVAAGDRYELGSLGRKVLGSRYRDLWTTPIRVPVVSPDTFAGGLELLQRGGGRQTASLRFGSEDGREWVFRSVDKDQSGGLHPDLEETIVDDIVQDQISSKHPGSALIVAPLLRAAGVLHAEPRLTVMADHPALGEFRSEFAGMLGMIEERPTEVEEGEGFRFGGYERLIGTDRLIERIRESAEDRPDAVAYLTARYIDLLVGDWDRHWDQWRWAQVDRGEVRYWLPIPRDRDNAFFHADGLIGDVGSAVRPFVIGFDEDYPSLYGLTYNARETDGLILPELTLEEWRRTAAEVQARLTDRVIADAVAELPPAYYDLSGREIERKLRSRRDRLQEIVPEFYRQLVHEAAVFGTDERDELRVDRESDGAVTVRLTSEDEGEYYRRRFVPAETREVRIFLQGGDDEAIVAGGGDGGILVRVLGGAGDDRLEDATVRGAGRTIFYDSEGENEIVRGPDTGVDRRAYRPPVPDTLTENNIPPMRDWGASHKVLSPDVGWESEVGPVLGLGPQWTRYGFRRSPYATEMRLQLQVAPFEGLFGVEVDAKRRLTGDRGETSLHAEATQIAVTRFHGFGNETPDGPNPDLTLVWSTRFAAGAEMVRQLADGFELGGGPAIAWIEPEPHLGSPASAGGVPGGESFGIAGLQLRTLLDTRDSESFPTGGAHLTASVEGYPLVWGDAAEGFVRSMGSVATYFPVPLPLESVLAVRVGGEHVLGEAPFQYAATLGGGSSMRGHRTDRFTGDASLFGSAELRSVLGRVDLLVARGDLGTILLADAGRVFVSGEDSRTLHSAFGGGLWFGLIDRRLTGYALFTVGERQELKAGLGVPF